MDEQQTLNKMHDQIPAKGRSLHPVIRYFIIAVWGVALSLVVFVFLKKVGY